MWRYLLVLLAACAPRAVTIDANHPANPRAETGRLAGPPPALRPGVVEPAAPPPAPTPPPHHHH